MRKILILIVVTTVTLCSLQSTLYAQTSKIREGTYIGKKVISDPTIPEQPLYLVIANKHLTAITGEENSGVKVERFDLASFTGQGLKFTRAGNKVKIDFEEDGKPFAVAKFVKGSNKKKVPFQGYYFVADELFGLLRSFINIGPDGSAVVSLEFTQPHRFFGRIDGNGKFDLIFNGDREDVSITTNFNGDEVTVSLIDSMGTASQTMKKE